MKTSVTKAAALFAAMIMTAGLAHAQEVSAELIAKAKQEGKVVYYTDLIVDQIVRPLVAGFEAKYGVKVEYARADSQANLLKLMGEHKAGSMKADVFAMTSGLKPLLEARGWEVRMTRSEDTSAELSGRVAIAEQAGAALFVSLHFNSGFPNTQAAGLETYCLTPRGLPSNVTRDFPDDASQAWPNNAFDAANLRLAFRVHRRLLAATGAADRGVKRARFMGVLRGQNRPAILVEGGYLSNPEEARKIGTPAYRQKLAEAVAGALE